MKYLHAMIRTNNPDKSIRFYSEGLGLSLLKQKDFAQGKFSLIFLGEDEKSAMVELTHNWDDSEYTNGNQFGHLAFSTENIYQACEKLQQMGVAILRPPRDGHMAFVKDPNGISIEILQQGDPLEVKEPWLSMKNQGDW